MMRSMFSGVSGLRTHQARMDVIGHNIANVNTVGFKASRMTFADTFSQTMQGASAPNAETGRGGTNPMQVGLGVNISSIQRLMTTGGAQRTDDPFHLMIEGAGFFVVGDDVGGLFFTRAGDFQQDRDWNIHLNGLRLQGWQAPWQAGGPAREDGVPRPIQSGPVQGIQILPSMRNVQPAATGNIFFEGNINPADRDIARVINFHDSLGQTYSMNMRFVFDETATPPAWRIHHANTITRTSSNPNETLTLSGVTAVGGWVEVTTPTLQFGPDGLPVMMTNANPPVAIPGAFEMHLQIDTTGASGPTFEIGQPHNPATPAVRTILIDFSGLTQYRRATNANASDMDGMESGDLVGLSIGPDGIVSGTYSNGQNFALWQIALATFDNPAGLMAMGSNLFSTTPNSGLFDGTGLTPGSAGTRLLGGTVEMSNVDLAAEFTEMITTQRGFQANSRIITTSDEILQELVNMKR